MTLYHLRQAIWGNTWKTTVEGKNAIILTMHPHSDAIWKDIWRKKLCYFEAQVSEWLDGLESRTTSETVGKNQTNETNIQLNIVLLCATHLWITWTGSTQQSCVVFIIGMGLFGASYLCYTLQHEVVRSLGHTFKLA